MSKKKATKAEPIFDAAPVLAVLKKHPDGIATADILKELGDSKVEVPGKRAADKSWKVITSLKAIPDKVQRIRTGKGLKRRSTWKLK